MMLRITRKIYEILDRGQKIKMVGLVLMMFLGGLLESVSVTVMLPLIKAVMDGQGDISFLIAALIVVFVVKNLYILLQSYVQATFIGRCRYRLQSRLIDSYMDKPYPFFLRSSTGEIVRIITNDTTNTFNLLSNTLVYYSELIVTAILAVTVLIMSPVIAVSIIVLLAVELAVITLLIRPLMRRYGNDQRTEQKLANKWVLQSVSGIKSIKVADNTQFFREKYKKHAGNVVEYERKTTVLNALPRSVIEAFTVAGILGMILVMLRMGAKATTLIPQLSAFMVAAVRLLPGANRISLAANGIANVEGALDNILAILDREDLTLPKETAEKRQDVSAISFVQSLRLDHISFSYEGSDVRILDDAEMEILPGQSVGIIGASGSGKTTTVDIILGLLKPEQGTVTSDGTDIHTALHAWLAHVAYVPQSIFLTDDTIRANVAFGHHRDEISDERVWEALKEAKLDDFVKAQPDQLDTGIGEAGVRLSGGQRQRIGIARALYENPDIIIFDEATSALDNETEAAIMESIDGLKGRKTTIIIAHRLTTTENCDVIYCVEKGKITRQDGQC